MVRRARPGETLDHAGPRRPARCTPTDILITDDTGPISMAGTMGGLATEIDDDSADIVIEGAHFSDTGDREDVPPSPAALRGVLPVRARHRPRAAAARHRARGRAARQPRRRDDRARRHARAGAGRAGDDRAWRPTTRTGSPASSTAWTRSSAACRRWAARCAARPPARRRRSRPGARARPRATGAAGGAHAPRAGTTAQRHGAARHAAVLAPRPDRPGRPGRGGHPARGLRQRAGPPAARPGGPAA